MWLESITATWIMISSKHQQLKLASLNSVPAGTPDEVELTLIGGLARCTTAHQCQHTWKMCTTHAMQLSQKLRNRVRASNVLLCSIASGRNAEERGSAENTCRVRASKTARVSTHTLYICCCWQLCINALASACIRHV